MGVELVLLANRNVVSKKNNKLTDLDFILTITFGNRLE